jgi:hypothetical protein
MSIQSVALAEGGVLLGYNMNETSGTNLADFSGNSLRLLEVLPTARPLCQVWPPR